MSYSAIFYILGYLMFGFGGAMLIPAITSILFYGEDSHSFVDTSAVTMFVGIIIILMNRSGSKDLGHKDAFLLTFLSWVTLSFIGALPIYFGHVTNSFVDAFFESVSGLTTTGASVLTGLDTMHHGILLWRSMLQWLGGMGVVVLATAILPFLGIGGMQLYKAEMPGVVKDKLQPRLKETAKLLWMVYLILTILCALLYFIGGMTPFDAICHAFTTVSSGGYSTHDASFGYFESPFLRVVAVIFMLAATVNFALHFTSFSGKGLKVYTQDLEFRFYIFLIIAAITACFLVLMYNGTMPLKQALGDSIFNMVSVVSTTGYSVSDYSSWPVLVPMMVMALMMLGGCAGSTAGGLKILRFMLIIKHSIRELKVLIHPHGVMRLKIGKSVVSDKVSQAVWSFAGFYVVSFTLITVALATYGYDLITAFSAAGATMSGLGPALGEVGPAGNYAGMPNGAKLVLCFSMLLGRLELFTLLVLFMPSFWRR